MKDFDEVLMKLQDEVESRKMEEEVRMSPAILSLNSRAIIDHPRFILYQTMTSKDTNQLRLKIATDYISSFCQMATFGRSFVGILSFMAQPCSHD